MKLNQPRFPIGTHRNIIIESKLQYSPYETRRNYKKKRIFEVVSYTYIYITENGQITLSNCFQNKWYSTLKWKCYNTNIEVELLVPSCLHLPTHIMRNSAIFTVSYNYISPYSSNMSFLKLPGILKMLTTHPDIILIL